MRDGLILPQPGDSRIVQHAGPPGSYTHRERVVEHFLRLFGFEVYLPRIRRYQIRYHRRVEFQTPLFAGYCFTGPAN
jgi:hypothetical protein